MFWSKAQRIIPLKLVWAICWPPPWASNDNLCFFIKQLPSAWRTCETIFQQRSQINTNNKTQEDPNSKLNAKQNRWKCIYASEWKCYWFHWSLWFHILLVLGTLSPGLLHPCYTLSLCLSTLNIPFSRFLSNDCFNFQLSIYFLFQENPIKLLKLFVKANFVYLFGFVQTTKSLNLIGIRASLSYLYYC